MQSCMDLKTDQGGNHMKTWNQPSLVELDLTATAYSPDSGSKVDGFYVDRDGVTTHYTYCPSGSEAPV